MASRPPEISISVELDRSVAPLLARADRFIEKLNAALSLAANDLINELGIPGEPSVQTAGASAEAPGLLRLTTNGEECHFSADLPRWTHHYVDGDQRAGVRSLEDVRRWLLDPQTDAARTVEFITTLCIEILKRQPRALLKSAHAEAYLASLRTNHSDTPDLATADANVYLPTLAALLELRVSLADTQRVATLVAAGAQRSPGELLEDLAGALHRDVIELQIDAGYLRQLTNGDREKTLDVFSLLREEMFHETGLAYPAFRFVPVTHLRANAFCFKINDLTTVPMLGLAADQRLINDTPRSPLFQSVDAIATINPASGQPGALIDVKDEPRATQAGLAVWNDVDYLILALAEVLRSTARCFVHLPAVAQLLRQVQTDLGAKDLVAAVQARVPAQQIAHVLRALAADGVSIRNMRTILESLLDCSLSAPDDHLDPDEWTTLVRTHLRRALLHKLARRTTTVVVYLVHEQIESVLTKTPAVTPADGNAIRAAIRAALAPLPETALMPVLLTSARLRAALREVVRLEFPRLNVIAYEDLPPDANVQPVGRVSLLG